MVRARVLLSSSMMRLGGWRGTGSVPYCSECPPIGAWPGGAGHFWKASGEGSMLPAGTEIMSFFGGRGGDSLADMHGSFTGPPSAREGEGWERVRETQSAGREWSRKTDRPVM